MASLITIEVLLLFIPGCCAASYWAYLPDPPVFHFATWDFALVKVTTDAVELLGEKAMSTCYIIKSLTILHLKVFLIHCLFVFLLILLPQLLAVFYSLNIL